LTNQVNAKIREIMTTLGPNQLRQNILAARAEIDSVRQLLLVHEKECYLALGYPS
jgi:hypothetical protein